MDFPLPAKTFFQILLTFVKLAKVPRGSSGVIEDKGREDSPCLVSLLSVVDLLRRKMNPH